MFSRTRIFTSTFLLLAFLGLLVVQLGCVAGQLEHCDREHGEHSAPTPRCHRDFCNPWKPLADEGCSLASGAGPQVAEAASLAPACCRPWRGLALPRVFCGSTTSLPLLA